MVGGGGGGGGGGWGEGGGGSIYTPSWICQSSLVATLAPSIQPFELCSISSLQYVLLRLYSWLLGNGEMVMVAMLHLTDFIGRCQPCSKGQFIRGTLWSWKPS